MNNNLLNNSNYKNNLYNDGKKRISILMGISVILLLSLIIGMIYVYRMPIIAIYNRYVGILLIFIYSIIYLKDDKKIPVGVILFALYLIWAFLSGIIVNIDWSNFYKIIKVSFQALFLIWAVMTVYNSAMCTLPAGQAQ